MREDSGARRRARGRVASSRRRVARCVGRRIDGLSESGKIVKVTVETNSGRHLELLNVHLQQATTNLRLWKRSCWHQHSNNRRQRFVELHYALETLKQKTAFPRLPAIIAGDFNVYPGATKPPEACDGSSPDPREAEQVYKLSAAGFVATVPECTATSSGLKNYDNVLVDHYTDSRYVCYSSVLRLAMQHKNSGSDKKKGISDHNPVVFTFQYSEGVKRSGA